MKNSKIYFEKASVKHQDLILKWLNEPHMQEFWDNSQEHKDDILNFIHGRKQHYFYGTTQYWVGYIGDQPFSFILSDQMLAEQDDITDLLREYLSKAGNTISLDFGIGNTVFLGKGLAAPTLKAFTEFYPNNNEYWLPKIVGDLNDSHVKLAKFKGEFVWHKHDNEDELFFIIKGTLLIKFRDQDITLQEGEFLIIPKGVEHLPIAEEEVHVMLIELLCGAPHNSSYVAKPVMCC